MSRSFSALRCAALLIAFTLSAPLFAQAKSEADPSGVAMLKSLSAARSDLTYTLVGESAMPGIYEVQVENGPLLYVAADGKHMLAGDLYAVRPGQFVNVREVKLAAHRKDVLQTIDTSKMITFSPKGETKGVLYVFTDVDCGYCRRLHSEMAELNGYGIEIRYLAYPRNGLDSPGYRKISSVWCAKDQHAAMDAAKAGAELESNLCQNNPVADFYRLGAEFGVNGTPAVVMEDGTMIPGYRPAKEFAKTLGLAQ